MKTHLIYTCLVYRGISYLTYKMKLQHEQRKLCPKKCYKTVRELAITSQKFLKGAKVSEFASLNTWISVCFTTALPSLLLTTNRCRKGSTRVRF